MFCLLFYSKNVWLYGMESSTYFRPVDHVAVRERIEVPTDSEKEMEEYNRDKTYMEQCQKSFNTWYGRDRANGDNKVGAEP